MVTNEQAFPQILMTDLQDLPIKRIGVKEQQPFVTVVKGILAITKDGDYLQNLSKQAQVREYEQQIDQMVYELYGLTKEEIKIVEGTTK